MSQLLNGDLFVQRDGGSRLEAGGAGILIITMTVHTRRGTGEEEAVSTCLIAFLAEAGASSNADAAITGYWLLRAADFFLVV